MYSGLSLKEENEICINENISPTELFILRLLLLAQEGDSSELHKYISNASNGKEIFLSVLENFLNKGIILKSFKTPTKGEVLRFNDIPINKNFHKRFLKDSHQLGKELFDLYPSFISINGRLASIKNITKAGLFSIDEFCVYYAKQIKNSITKHNEIIECLEFGIENDLINYSLLEFIASQKYEELKYIKESGNISGYKNTELL